MQRYKAQKESGGSRNEKLEKIKEQCFAFFMDAKKHHLIVHDDDVQRWAILVNNTFPQPLPPSQFSASRFFVYNWKKEHRIVSRKVTKFVSLQFADEEKKIEEDALQFVLEVQSLIPNDFPPHRVINIDQMGVNLEVVSGRTLEIEGEKAVIKSVQTPNAIQHSSTVMPAITAAGQLMSPLYICMKETNQEAAEGRFGPQVEESMFRHPNIHVVANTSAIMNKARTMEYFRDVLFPSAPNNFS